MPEQVTLLSSRRAYNFRPEGIRLTMLSTPAAQERIRVAFSFQASVIGTPQPTFGDIPATYPPGLVFNLGVHSRLDGQLVPIRLIHIEPRRIVIDVAGPSYAIEEIYSQVRNCVQDLVAPDGQPAIGEPYETLDYSEIVAHLDVPPDVLAPPPILAMGRRAVSLVHDRNGFALVPAISLILQDPRDVFPGLIPESSTRTIQLAPRQGYPIDEQVYFSAAPFASTSHLEYLTALEQALVESADSQRPSG